MMKTAETNESLTKEKMMMDRSVSEGLSRLMPPDETLCEYFIFTFSLLAGVWVYLVNEVKSLGATYGILQLPGMLAIAHVLRFVQSVIYKVPPKHYLQDVLKYYDLLITATISIFYIIFLMLPSPPNIVLFPALFLMFGIVSAPTRMELGIDDISPTRGSSSTNKSVNQQNPIDIQVTDHFSSIVLAVICVHLAVELEKLKGTYYVFSMVLVLTSRHMPYIWQIDLPENNVPLAFYLRKVLQYYELPSTAAINGIYMIFSTFSKTLLIVFFIELTLLAVLMYKREEPEQGTNPTQASSFNTNSSSVHHQSPEAANIGDIDSISYTNNFDTNAVHQSDFSKWKKRKEIGHDHYGHAFVYENSENSAEKRAVKRLNISADGTNESTLRRLKLEQDINPNQASSPNNESVDAGSASVHDASNSVENAAHANSTFDTNNSSRWIHKDRIGSGGFGTVFVAENRETQAIAAVKVLKDYHEPENVESIQKEIEVLSRMEHPNIVKYFDHEIVGGDIYLYMEYIQPGSLGKVISKQGVLHEPLIRNFTAQILSGLDYLHRERVVHRDIKPDNILVGPNNTIKLADFGLAKHLQHSVGNHSKLGTYPYAAPEVLRKKEYNSSLEAFAADIWSLGCVIIEMFTGQIPWPDSKMKNSRIEEICPEGKEFLKRCFEENPDKRASAEELLGHPFVRATN